MAANPTPQPDDAQGGTLSPGGVPPAQQQANPLQQQLAAAAKAMETLAQQNPIVQAELMEARTALVKALQKTMMASRPQQQEPQAGQGQ